MLALAYLTDAEFPTGIKSVILCAPCVSTSDWVQSITTELFPHLPTEIRTTIEHAESTKSYHTKEFAEAVDFFYRQHLCRLSPWPECMQQSAEAMSKTNVYEYMWGPTEFSCVGTLKGFEYATKEKLEKIPKSVRILWTAGELDECRPSSLEKFKGLRGNESDVMHVFKDGSHCHHLECREEFEGVLKGFLKDVEGK